MITIRAASTVSWGPCISWLVGKKAELRRQGAVFRKALNAPLSGEGNAKTCSITRGPNNSFSQEAGVRPVYEIVREK
eukprot:5136151-Pyramimonas_sp.AAC.1